MKGWMGEDGRNAGAKPQDSAFPPVPLPLLALLSPSPSLSSLPSPSQPCSLLPSACFPVLSRPYPWHSIEGQMRHLADLAFLLKHYEFAASLYRLAAQDYLAHNNLRWYAGAEVGRGEMGVIRRGGEGIG
jgi:hypothetical protein